MKNLREKISIKGVVIGSVADIVGTNIWAFFFILYLLFSHQLLASVPRSQLETEVTSLLRDDPLNFTINLLAGSFFSILGGYIAAHIAKRHELLNGALSSFLCVLLGLYSTVSGTGSASLWLHLLGFILSPALGLLGGFLKLKQHSRPPLSGKLVTTEQEG